MSNSFLTVKAPWQTTWTNQREHPYHRASCYIRRDAAEVLRVEVFKVGLSHSNRNSDSQTGIVDERHYRIIALAADYVLVSIFVHSGHIPVPIFRKVFDCMVGDAVRPLKVCGTRPEICPRPSLSSSSWDRRCCSCFEAGTWRRRCHC